MARPEGYAMATLADHVGHDFGSSEPVTVDQAMIDRFADLTGDHQWIHVDVARAEAESPFGGTVAHGYLTLSLVAAAVESAGISPPDASAVLNYGLDKVRFLAPVLAGSVLRARFRLVGVEEKGPGQKLLRVETTLQADGAEKPAVVAELLALAIG